MHVHVRLVGRERCLVWDEEFHQRGTTVSSAGGMQCQVQAIVEMVHDTPRGHGLECNRVHGRGLPRVYPSPKTIPTPRLPAVQGRVVHAVAGPARHPPARSTVYGMQRQEVVEVVLQGWRLMQQDTSEWQCIAKHTIGTTTTNRSDARLGSTTITTTSCFTMN